jgi:hypothetical protein
MYPLLLVGLFAVPGALAALVLAFLPKLSRTAVVASTVVMASGAFALGLGEVGKLAGERATMHAVANVNPADRATILAAGRAESKVALGFGALLGVPALLAGALCLALAVRRLPAAAAGAPR